MSNEFKEFLGELTKTNITLAAVATEIKGLTKVFDKHLEDDEKVEERVQRLELSKAKLVGMCIAASAFVSIALKYWG